jgi:hypothetical protein
MSTQTPDVDQLSQWIGRTETRTDLIALGKASALAATLDLASSPVEVMPCRPCGTGCISGL